MLFPQYFAIISIFNSCVHLSVLIDGIIRGNMCFVLLSIANQNDLLKIILIYIIMLNTQFIIDHLKMACFI